MVKMEAIYLVAAPEATMGNTFNSMVINAAAEVSAIGWNRPRHSGQKQGGQRAQSFGRLGPLGLLVDASDRHRLPSGLGALVPLGRQRQALSMRGMS